MHRIASNFKNGRKPEMRPSYKILYDPIKKIFIIYIRFKFLITHSIRDEIFHEFTKKKTKES